jgi:integrase/recombinase XerD
MELFDRFLQERTYLKGVSSDTLAYYRNVRRAFQTILAEPTKQGMLESIQKLLAGGVSPISVNTYLRGFKAYIRWLQSEGHTKEVFKVQFLKTDQKILQTLSEAAVTSILKFSPQCSNDRRIHAFVCLLLDTGMRLSEGLAVRRSDIDWDNMVIKLKGKGSKYRLVPMSVEGRKILFKFANRHQHELIFSTRSGLPLSRRNAGRDSHGSYQYSKVKPFYIRFRWRLYDGKPLSERKMLSDKYLFPNYENALNGSNGNAHESKPDN